MTVGWSSIVDCHRFISFYEWFVSGWDYTFFPSPAWNFRGMKLWKLFMYDVVREKKEFNSQSWVGRKLCEQTPTCKKTWQTIKALREEHWMTKKALRISTFVLIQSTSGEQEKTSFGFLHKFQSIRRLFCVNIQKRRRRALSKRMRIEFGAAFSIIGHWHMPLINSSIPSVA